MAAVEGNLQVEGAAHTASSVICQGAGLTSVQDDEPWVENVPVKHAVHTEESVPLPYMWSYVPPGHCMEGKEKNKGRGLRTKP